MAKKGLRKDTLRKDRLPKAGLPKARADVSRLTNDSWEEITQDVVTHDINAFIEFLQRRENYDLRNALMNNECQNLLYDLPKTLDEQQNSRLMAFETGPELHCESGWMLGIVYIRTRKKLRELQQSFGKQ